MMSKRLLRFGAMTPVLLLALLPVAASADSDMAVSIGSSATRASLAILVPIWRMETQTSPLGSQPLLSEVRALLDPPGQEWISSATGPRTPIRRPWYPTCKPIRLPLHSPADRLRPL